MCRMSGVSRGRLLLVGGVLSRRVFFWSVAEVRPKPGLSRKNQASSCQQRPV